MAGSGPILRIFSLCLVLVFTPECSGDCAGANSCLETLKGLVANNDTLCTSKLNSFVTAADCVDQQLKSCSEKVQEITDQLKTQISIFEKDCAVGCLDVRLKFGKIRECLGTRDYGNLTELETLIDDVILSINTRRPNSTLDEKFNTMMACYEKEIDNCGLLRKLYGELFIKFEAIPVIQKIKKSLLPINSENPKSAIIEECPGTTVREEVKRISSKCPLSKSRTQPVQQINEYCVILQKHIDCVLDYESKCPLAVTRFLGPIMSSIGAVHAVFCSNLTIFGVRIDSVTLDCTTDTYQEVYVKCWAHHMRDIATAGDYKNLNQESLLSFFNWTEYQNKEICRTLADAQNYNYIKLRECAAELDGSCPLPFPYLGTVEPLPLMFDLELYKIIEAGLMPLNEYGAWFLQMKRDYLCYNECVNYTAHNVIYVADCQNKLRTLAADVNGTRSDGKCQDFANHLNCARSTTVKCPLFQYQTRELLLETKISAAISGCGLLQPKLLPDDYYLATTTLGTPSSTTYWVAPSNKSESTVPSISDTASNIVFQSVYITPLLYSFRLIL